MEFMNIVRLKFKDGQLDAWREIVQGNFAKMKEMGGIPGMLETRHVQYGPNEICVVGRWESKEALIAARPMLIQNLDSFRHLLEETSAGITDPISGAVIFSTNS